MVSVITVRQGIKDITRTSTIKERFDESGKGTSSRDEYRWFTHRCSKRVVCDFHVEGKVGWNCAGLYCIDNSRATVSWFEKVLVGLAWMRETAVARGQPFDVRFFLSGIDTKDKEVVMLVTGIPNVLCDIVSNYCGCRLEDAYVQYLCSMYAEFVKYQSVTSLGEAATVVWAFGKDSDLDEIDPSTSGTRRDFCSEGCGRVDGFPIELCHPTYMPNLLKCYDPVVCYENVLQGVKAIEGERTEEMKSCRAVNRGCDSVLCDIDEIDAAMGVCCYRQVWSESMNLVLTLNRFPTGDGTSILLTRDLSAYIALDQWESSLAFRLRVPGEQDWDRRTQLVSSRESIFMIIPDNRDDNNDITAFSKRAGSKLMVRRYESLRRVQRLISRVGEDEVVTIIKECPGQDMHVNLRSMRLSCLLSISDCVSILPDLPPLAAGASVPYVGK